MGLLPLKLFIMDKSENQPLYDFIMLENPISMSEFLGKANRYIRLEEDMRQDQKRKRIEGRKDSQLEVT